MSTTAQRIIFSNSYFPRTGHNFASEAIKVFSDHEVLAHQRAETRLSIVLDAYYKIRQHQVVHQSDKDFLDHLFIANIREQILAKSDRPFIMIKDTSFVGKDWLPELFPNDIHIVLIRDPYAVFNSIFKAMDLRKKTFKNLLKRIGKTFGLYPYYFCRKVSKQIFAVMPDFEKHMVVRYEDLVNKDETTLLKLKEVFQTDKSLEQLKSDIDAIEVINSSFFEEVGAKKIWEAKKKTEKFNPVNRKANTALIRMGVALGSKQLRQHLGYL